MQNTNFEKSQIVVLSSIEWDAAWQRHQIFASQFAEAGHEVFFVENTGFRNPGLRDLPRVFRKARALASGRRSAGAAGREREFSRGAERIGPLGAAKAPAGIRIINPVVLPPTAGLFRGINKSVFAPFLVNRLRKSGLKPHPIVIVYLATATTLELIRRLEPSLLIHDCASHFAANPGAPRDFGDLQRRLLDQTALVVADSDFLFDLMKAKHPRVIQIHQGVPDRFFEAAPPSGGWKRFCYYGTWVPDMNPELLNALAAAGFEVAVSGFMKGNPPRFHPSIRRLEPVAREDLVRRLEQFDVFLLPHRITEFHKGVIPAKIYECLAMGRPIIAMPLPSLAALKNLLYIADSPDGWLNIARNLTRTETPAIRESRIRLAREHTREREFAKLYGELKSAWRPPQ